MNRRLTIPAGCCIVAFGVVYAALHGAVDADVNPSRQRVVSSELANLSSVSSSAAQFDKFDRRLLSVAEVEQSLISARDAWLRPWRQWESAPHRLYSRVAPRPIPSLSAEIQLASESLGESAGCLVGIISVHKGGAEPFAIPCVVDRFTSRTRFFHDGRWLTEEEWVATAPAP